MKKALIISSLLICAAMQLSGCSLDIYPTDDISKNPKAVLFNINDIEHLTSFPFYELEIDSKDEKLKVNIEQDDRSKIIEDFLNKIKANAEPGAEDIHFRAKYTVIPFIREIDTKANKKFSVKYSRSSIDKSPNVYIPIEFTNGCKYRASVDSGFNGYVLLTPDIVIDNKLTILPSFSACSIPVLNFGPAQIKDALAYYDYQQWQFRILNIPIYRFSDILLGRGFLKMFDYVMFDNVKKEVVFSKEGPFVPDDFNFWTSYSFYEDPNHFNTIMVKMPISGKVFDIAFDSCGYKPGLDLNQNDWDDISKDLTFNLRKSNYLSGQFGRLPCRKATISELTIGEKKIKSAEVIIFNEKDQQSILSLGYFQDTVIVLDYVNNLFWVKK